jgi:hypothetical protein
MAVTDTSHPRPPANHTSSHGHLIAAGILAGLASICPPRLSVPVLFLALALFGWWSAETVPSGPVASKHAQGWLGLTPAILLFTVGLFTGPLSILCFTGSAGCYWHWLNRRSTARRNSNLLTSREP